MSPVKIVIPDTGPLITLAKADALELLLSFGDNVRLVFTDVVEFEATRYRDDHPDAAKICDFITANLGRITIEKTSFGEMAISAAKTRQQYDENPNVQEFYKSQGMSPPAEMRVNSGELSIVSYISGLIAEPPGVPCLVIAEDDFFLRSNSGALPGNAHIISTMALLQALEAIDPRFSAKAVIDAASSAGREANQAIVDKPAAKVAGSTTWRGLLNSDDIRKSVAARRKRIGKRGGKGP